MINGENIPAMKQKTPKFLEFMQILKMQTSAQGLKLTMMMMMMMMMIVMMMMTTTTILYSIGRVNLLNGSHAVSGWKKGKYNSIPIETRSVNERLEINNVLLWTSSL